MLFGEVEVFVTEVRAVEALCGKIGASDKTSEGGGGIST
jgi:hypothetical protein